MNDFKLVPVKPTPEMERAAESYWNERRFMGLSDDPRTWAGVYQAMLAAAPAVQGEPFINEVTKMTLRAEVDRIKSLLSEGGEQVVTNRFAAKTYQGCPCRHCGGRRRYRSNQSCVNYHNCAPTQQQRLNRRGHFFEYRQSPARSLLRGNGGTY